MFAINESNWCFIKLGLSVRREVEVIVANAAKRGKFPECFSGLLRRECWVFATSLPISCADRFATPRHTGCGCWAQTGSGRPAVDRARSGKQGRERFAGFAGAHEGFADKKGIDAVVAHQSDVVGGEDAAFGDDNAIFRDEGQ